MKTKRATRVASPIRRENAGLFLFKTFPCSRPFHESERGSAGFQTCCIADFQIGRPFECKRFAGLEARDTVRGHDARLIFEDENEDEEDLELKISHG